MALNVISCQCISTDQESIRKPIWPMFRPVDVLVVDVLVYRRLTSYEYEFVLKCVLLPVPYIWHVIYFSLYPLKLSHFLEYCVFTSCQRLKWIDMFFLSMVFHMKYISRDTYITSTIVECNYFWNLSKIYLNVILHVYIDYILERLYTMFSLRYIKICLIFDIHLVFMWKVLIYMLFIHSMFACCHTFGCFSACL